VKLKQGRWRQLKLNGKAVLARAWLEEAAGMVPTAGTRTVSEAGRE
jgi:hypothetical protein